MSFTGFIDIIPTTHSVFENTNDMVIYTNSNSQKIILGVNSNSVGK